MSRIVFISMFVTLNADWIANVDSAQETALQHEHRSSRLKYLSMRQERYQNVIDTNIFKLVSLYLEDGDYAKALPVLHTVASQSPDEESRWTALYAIGDIEWVEFDRISQAIQAFEKVQGTLKPICDGALAELYGQLGSQEGSETMALAALNRLEQQARQDQSRYVREHALENITYAKVKIYQKTGDKNKAIQACRSLVSSVQDDGIKNKAERTIRSLEGR